MHSAVLLCYAGGMKDDRTGTIYMLTAPSGKRYVGQTWDFERRMKRYAVGDGVGQRAIHAAVKKYGWENFDAAVIACGIQTQDALNQTEMAFIVMLGSVAPNGYNLRTGATGGRVSEKTRKRMSEGVLRAQKKPGYWEKTLAGRSKTMYSPEYKRRLSVSIKAAVNRPEVRARHLAAMATPEYKAKQAAAQAKVDHRAVQNRPEVKAKHAASIKVANANPEYLAARSAGAKASWKDPVSRRNKCDGMRRAHARKRRARRNRIAMLSLVALSTA